MNAYRLRKAIVDAVLETGRWKIVCRGEADGAYKTWLKAKRVVPINWTDILDRVQAVDSTAEYRPAFLACDVAGIRGNGFSVLTNTEFELYVITYKENVITYKENQKRAGATMTQTLWRHFTIEELACPCCGRMAMEPAFMRKVEAARIDCGFAFVVTSAYRCAEHNAKVSETGKAGPHTTGHAIDLALHGRQVMTLIAAARYHGILTGRQGGLGLHQHGPEPGRFVHLDDLWGTVQRPRPWVWTYP